uniref:Uncharacterized protein n=1 Tax=Entomoneis paludosa TaxID=265537 RepID=A0A7S2YG67_9STRA|mmetsp:Transcript_31498/g.65780  ORF Transcript_31498/g.65780 Transcript_31498/m.65780 type:complete len:880 (+) Transcript_31498:189-2828(+)|eukprot:CAMPEP_0172468206 /NCGR_PEP_ID=MMETSP1065-20121228/60855_1 /TAXON_ID=265537 /ORGANISM="Amphiprora paludosa, Strain CCMP125" /LENGTH=879 /DNA_ID=CAMNT_0013225559 /DNA_START=124 /DNA_END=2763 /DNA_ORIENTATION=+
MVRFASAALVVAFAAPAVAFTPQSLVTPPQQRAASTWNSRPIEAAALFASPRDEETTSNHNESRFHLRRRFKKLVLHNPIVWSVVTVVVGAATPLGGAVLRTKPAWASAPVMALPKAEDRDPGTDAMQEHERAMRSETQRELDEMASQAREIEKTQGPAARMKFEKDFKAKQEERAAQKAKDFIQLKRDLLDQGIDPWCDLEGQRQVIKHERGVDLAEVDGTPFNYEAIQQQKGSRDSMLVQKAPHRDIIKLMVQDMKNRDVDPLEYFENHKDQTMTILEMQFPYAVTMVKQYKANMEEYGQITVPKPGEVSVKEKLAALNADPKRQKELAKQQKAEEQAKAKAEKARIQAEQKAERERLKAEAKAAKEEAKRVKEAEKEQAKMAKAAAAAAAAAGAASAAAGAAASAGASTIESAAEALATQPEAATASTLEESASIGSDEEGSAVGAGSTAAVVEETKSSSNLLDKVKIVPASIALISVGGGAYGLNIVRGKKAQEEEERQRQFKLLMEGDGSSSASSSDSAMLDALDSMDLDDDVSSPVSEPPKPAPVAAAPPAPAAPKKKAKKRRLGIFKSKGGDRETDLRNMVASDAQAPVFATLLGKILTFGAPGRFPDALAILGSDMPMEEFDLEKANEILSEARVAAGLEISQSAEIFANVVNCMLIDIVDLASSSLKEKESKVTVDAINIVVDFMNHAASIYDAVAESATINPVTYSGSLAKSKLEQMYSQYAVGGMMNMGGMADDFDSRVALLQDVFSINEKKAEGLMMKAMQKNMMEMMKDGGGEGMESMMANMGMDPSALMGGDSAEGEMDPEQLKSMLLELKGAKDRGEISDEELSSVRTMFKETFGSSLDDLMAQSDGASPEDLEVLELMKSVLG